MIKQKKQAPVGNAPSNIAVSKAQASLCRNPDSACFFEFTSSVKNWSFNLRYIKKNPARFRAGFFFALGFNYFVAKIAIPGSVFPSRNSREAPPPVDTWLILSARWNLFTAATESPPPTTVIAPRPVASATS